MKKKTLRILAAMLVFALLLSCCPALPLQVSAATATSGTCGDNVTWTLDDAGTLTISGTGKMYDFFAPAYVSWYDNRGSIKTVVIENGVSSIGNYAFDNCDHLTSVIIPDGVTSIGIQAFNNCRNLTSVTIPDSVTTIYYNAFKDCSSLTAVAIGDSVTSIGNSAFWDCDSLTNITIGDSVTTIGEYAFCGCDNLSSVTIGNSVTTIGIGAFHYCSSLTSITIPDSVTSIGGYAFSGCSSLTGITIGDNVTAIGYYAFDNCNSLTDVYITDPSAWCKIDFYYNSSNPVFHADRLHILDAQGNEVTEVILDDTVTIIPGYAFKGSSLTSITIPESVTTIGDYAFYNCSSLTTVIYCGTQAQWDAVSIGSSNTPLNNATLQFHNYQNGVCTVCSSNSCAPDAHTGGTATCTKKAVCTVCGIAYGELLPHTPAADDGDCTTAVVCTICGGEVIAAKVHSYTDIEDTTCNNTGCTYTRTVIYSTLTVTTGTNDAPITWTPELSEGMIPAYAKTTAEGGLVLEGASESDYNLKVEWPTGGKPTLTMKDATLTSDVIYPNKKNIIQIEGTADFEILLKGTNTLNSHPARANAEDYKISAYRCPFGIAAYNKGTLTIKGENKANDKLAIHSWGGNGLDNRYNALNIENVDFSIILYKDATASSYPAHALLMQYYADGYEDKTNLTVKNSNFAIDCGKSYGAYALVFGKSSDAMNTANTGDVLFQNSVVSFIRKNSTGQYKALVQMGANATVTFDRCDVTTYSWRIVFDYVPTMLNYATASYREEVSSSKYTDHDYDATVAGTTMKIRWVKSTHICVDGDCTTADTCDMCGSTATAMPYHIPAEDDGDCTTPLLCTNEGCSYIFGAAKETHTPAVDDGDCSTATPCTVCGSIAIPAPGHIPAPRASCAEDALCTVCGKIALHATPHRGGTATCQAKAKCTECGVEYGELGGHSGGTATCQAKAVCIACNQPYGALGSHSYTDLEDTSCNIAGCTYIRAAVIAGGTCGDNLTWTLDDAGTLTISGTGPMAEGDWWNSYKSAVKMVVVENGVTTIRSDAFSECPNLTSVTIGSDVTYIEPYVFSGSTALLTGILVDANNLAYCSDEEGVLYNKAKTQLIQAPGQLSGSYIIPDTVTYIAAEAFFGCSKLTNVTIPDSVTHLDRFVFGECTGLINIVIPKSVTAIGYAAFTNCHGLAGFYVDADNPAFASDEKGVLFNKARTELIQAPAKLSGSYVIPEGITDINGGAFNNCSNLTAITIPTSVKIIGEFALNYSIEKVYYNGNLEQWEQIVFGAGNEDVIAGKLYLNAPVVANITLNTQPNKLVYRVGETLDITGLTLTATYSDGSTATITEGFAVTGFDSNTAGEKVITVTYKGFTATFTVDVSEPVVDETDPQIFVESKKAVKGSTFTVTVQIKNNPGFCYLEMTPVIAPELTLVKVENGQLISDFTKDKQYVWAADGDVTEDGILMTFTFSVADGVEPGNYKVGFLVRTCGNYDEESVKLGVAAGNIEVIDYVYGDATGDGVVDGFDVIRLKKYLANYDYDTETSTVEISAGADANGDGIVDGFDVIRLKKYLASYDYETGTSATPLGPQ